MRRILTSWSICAVLFLGPMVPVDAGAGSVQLSGYNGDAVASRIVAAQRLSGDGSKVVFVEKLSNNLCCQSLSSWVSPQNPAAADAARVFLYDIASQTRTLLYQSKFSKVTVGADTLLQSLEDGFSADINADGSKVVIAYTSTSFNAARTAVSSSLRIDLIDTGSLAVTPVTSLALAGWSAMNVPIRMSELALTAVFAYEPAGNTTTNTWGVDYLLSSDTKRLMAVQLVGGAQAVELSSSGVSGTGTFNELVGFIDSRYAGFFDVSADGGKVVYQHSGDGKVMGVMSDGSGKHEIASVTPAKAAYVSISGDGQTVAYADRGANFAILYANTFAGGQQREINRSGTYWAGGLILNGDGSNLLYHTQDAGPGSSFGGNSSSFQIATAAGSAPEMITYELRDASGLGGKVLTSEYNSANLFLSTIVPLGVTTTTTTTSSTSTSTAVATSTTASATTTTIGSTTTTTQVVQGIYGTNLIVNGDAEAGAGSADGSMVTIPGWTMTGSMTAVRYGPTGGWPTSSSPGPINRGSNFFAGGTAANVSTISQLIDLSAAAGEIDTGHLSYVLSGFLGGFEDQYDHSVLSVDFKNAAGSVVGSGSVGPVTRDDRGGATGLLYRDVFAAVPSATRSAEVKLTVTWVNGGYVDGYADNLSLMLTMGGGGTTSTTGGSTTSTSATTTSTSATTTTTGSTTTTTLSGGATTMNVIGGWNLLGNSSSANLDVGLVFGDSAKVTTVWKWVAAGAKWAFYTPTIADGGAAYAASKGYDFMTTVSGGEGFWVNAKTAFTASLPAGTAVNSASFQSMAAGWNLIAIGDSKTPSAFNKAIGLTPPNAGEIPINLTTLWTWDASLSNWYFYAPSLEKSGGLGSYITSKNYLDFGSKVLDPTTGFWVNKPQ